MTLYVRLLIVWTPLSCDRLEYKVMILFRYRANQSSVWRSFTLWVLCRYLGLFVCSFVCRGLEIFIYNFLWYFIQNTPLRSLCMCVSKKKNKIYFENVWDNRLKSWSSVNWRRLIFLIPWQPSSVCLLFLLPVHLRTFLNFFFFLIFIVIVFQ